MPSEIGPPCSCFSTCDPISTRRFLQDIPATVTSASSPWYAYLRAVYAGDVPPLPFHLTRLRYVHHHDTAWRRKHPDVEWPMPPCGKLPQPLGGTPDGQWWAPMTWQGRKRIKPLRTPQCEAAVCSRWKTGEGDAQNQTRRQAAREEELKLHVELFAGEGNRTTRGTRWHFTTRRGVNPDVLLPNESWVEVMRTRVTGEGANGNGVWYSRAAGSGIWINVGRRTWHIADKQEATGIRPHRPGLPGDLVTPWLRHAFGRLQEGDLIRRTPQFWAKLYERSANITHAQLSAHLMAHEGFELRPVMLRPQAMRRLHGVGGGDVFPFMAYELQIDSVQIRTSDYSGGSAGTSEIVLTGDPSMAGGPGCCAGCSARERVLACALTKRTCGGAELRSGWAATRSCGCDGAQMALNCDLSFDSG